MGTSTILIITWLTIIDEFINQLITGGGLTLNIFPTILVVFWCIPSCLDKPGFTPCDLDKPGFSPHVYISFTL